MKSFRWKFLLLSIVFIFKFSIIAAVIVTSWIFPRLSTLPCASFQRHVDNILRRSRSFNFLRLNFQERSSKYFCLYDTMSIWHFARNNCEANSKTGKFIWSWKSWKSSKSLKKESTFKDHREERRTSELNIFVKESSCSFDILIASVSIDFFLTLHYLLFNVNI